MLRTRSFLILITFVLTLFTTLSSQATTVSPLREIRGVWLTNVDSTVMFSQETIEPALTQLSQLHFNTIYPTVWNWGYTLYPSEVAKQTIGYAVDPTVPAFQHWDVLADMVEQGHQQSLTVIPWFEFGFMTPADSTLATLHPDWITRRRNGTEIWQDGTHERKWLNPFKPDVQNFIQQLVLEIVTRYDVDGIQFDDHFGLPAEFGYDDFTVQLYRREHHGQSPPANPHDAEWIRWRADKITGILTKIFTQIKASKPNAIVSLAPNPYNYSYNYFLQDWHTWERRGLIEELMLQVYDDPLNTFKSALLRPEVQSARQHIPTGIGILVGLRDHPVTMRQVQQRVQFVRSCHFSGMSFFFYETLWNLAPEQSRDRLAALRTLFPSSATRPEHDRM